MAVLFVTGLSGCGGSAANGVPKALPIANSTNGHGSGTLSISISIPKQSASTASRRPLYISPSTASIAIVITPTGQTTGGTQTFDAALSPTATGCSSSLASTVCVLNLTLAPGTYVGSFTTADKNGNALSSATDVAITIVAGEANTIGATLGALPASYAIAPYPGSLSAVKPGMIEPVGMSSQFIIDALDADGNVIVGAGAPTYSVALSGDSNTNVLTAVQPTSSAPNTFAIDAGSFDGTQQTLTLTATLAGGATCGGAVACSATFTIAPQEIVALDSYQPAGTIQFFAYPDNTLAMPALTASTTAQGLTVDNKGDLYFFNGSSFLPKSAYPYMVSATVPTRVADATAVRLTYDFNTAIDVSDPNSYGYALPPYFVLNRPFITSGTFIVAVSDPIHNNLVTANGSGGSFDASYSSLSGRGTASFDAIYCGKGFGTSNSQDAFLMTYDGSGSPSIAVEFVSPNKNGYIQAFPAGTAIAAQAYQIACDPSGNVTVYYNGALNHFVPGATSPGASLAASLPYVQPYGLTTDSAGNIFYAQTNGLIVWDGSSSTATTYSLPYTPGTIAVIP